MQGGGNCVLEWNRNSNEQMFGKFRNIILEQYWLTEYLIVFK